MLAGSVAGLCLLLCACSLEDDRDICCGNIRMEIRYVPYGVEELATYIRSLRHFVFDAGGRFVREIPSGEPIRMLRFSLPDGDYTLLTLGNAESPLAFEAGDRTLATLEMELAGLTPSGEYLDADELYWGVCRMHVDGSRQQTFTTYMNNIHCHLHVKVMWHNMPEDVGAYRMEIGQVPVGYSLCPDRCHTEGDKLIPQTTESWRPMWSARPSRRRSCAGSSSRCAIPRSIFPSSGFGSATRPLRSLSTCGGLSGRGAGIPTLRPYRNTASSSRFLPTAAWRCARGSTPMSRTGRTEEHSTDRGG